MMNKGKSCYKKAGLINFLSVVAIMVFSASILNAQGNDFPDSDITIAVSDVLIEDHAVIESWINIKTHEGIVTLGGTTDNIMAKDRAASLAKTVKGVRGVINNIEVLPAYKTDADIKNDIQQALLQDPAAESYEITFDVDNGVVSLKGVVDSWQEKILSERIAKGISGVKNVKNNIDVNYKTIRSDSEIRNEIVEALRWNRYVDDALVDVRVNDGNVILDGSVASLAEKNEAYYASLVAGVKSVNTSNLEVDVWNRDERFRTEKYVTKEDSEIEKALQDALIYDPRVFSFNVDASSENGNVILSGTVNNLKAKRSAAQTARNIVGVWRVDNRIKVRPDSSDDDKIQDSVNNALLYDPYTNSYEIDVSVNKGVVTLTGTVDSYFEKAQADDIASRINGVSDVNNNLEVSDVYDIAVYNPYVDYDWYLYDYPWYVYPTYVPVVTDGEIKDDIEGQLWWSPFVDSDEVNVTVDNGIATLTGSVDTWNEYWTAQENAYEGGAVFVKNNLKLDYGPDYLF